MGMEWLGTNAGRNLLGEETRRVRSALESIFGDQFLQIGAWGSKSFRDFSRTKRTAVVAERHADGIDMIVALDGLAIANDSIDVVLLPHVLETHDDPHAVLREVDRILRTDGHILILGFNPVSLWGMRHLLSRRRFPPGIQRLISQHRLRDWLRLLNFSVSHLSFQYFQSSMFRRVARDRHDDTKGVRRKADLRANFWASLKAWWRHAPFGGCYLLVARKEMFTMTPIRPVWAPRRRMVGRLVKPATRTAA